MKDRLAKQLIANKSSEKKTLEDIELENKIVEVKPEILHPNRFMILNSLFRYDALDFVVLKRATHSKSDGHLASHIKALERLKIIMHKKENLEGKRRTYYMLTEQGREEFKNLARILKASLKDIENV